jgi:hypothetical protein
MRADDVGGVHLAWNMDLFHSRWDGTAWSEQENITGYTAAAGTLRTFTDSKGVVHVTRDGELPPKPSQPEIEVDASGYIHVAWESRGEVWYSKWDRRNWSDPYRLTDGTANSLWPVLSEVLYGTCFSRDLRRNP